MKFSYYSILFYFYSIYFILWHFLCYTISSLLVAASMHFEFIADKDQILQHMVNCSYGAIYFILIYSIQFYSILACLSTPALP